MASKPTLTHAANLSEGETVIRAGEVLVIVGWSRPAREAGVRFLATFREMPLFEQDRPEPLVFDWLDLAESNVPERRVGDAVEGMRLAGRSLGRSIFFGCPPSARAFRTRPPYSRLRFADLHGYGRLLDVADVLVLADEEPTGVRLTVARAAGFTEFVIAAEAARQP